MIGLPEERAIMLGIYIRDTGATVRSAGLKYGLSKSTVHKDVSDRLKRIDYALYKEVKAVLDKNRNERHIRGGEATRRKYSESNMQHLNIPLNKSAVIPNLA